MAEGIYGNESASFEVWCGCLEGAENDVANGGWQNFLGADLNYTGTVCAQRCQQDTEVEIRV